MHKNARATWIGSFSIIFWSLGALITTGFKNLPSYEILCFTLGSASLSLFALISIQGKWHLLKKGEWLPVLLASLMIFGLQYFYNEAFKYAPALHADLINYLWPIHVLVLSSLLPNENLTQNQMKGALVAFFGIMLLLYNSESSRNMGPHYMYGLTSALLDGLCWAGYSLVTRYFKNIPLELTAIYFGISALLAIILHVKCEVYVAPSWIQFIGLTIMGVFVIGSACMLWTYGVKYGNYKLMSVLSYITPLLSIGFLAIFHKASLNLTSVIASLFVAVGVFICSDKKKTKKRSTPIFYKNPLAQKYNCTVLSNIIRR